MTLRENIGWIYFMYPYMRIIKNKYMVIFLILCGANRCRLRFADGQALTLAKPNPYHLYCLLGALCFATSFKIGEKIQICLDMKNTFTISLDSREDQNLLELMFWGSRFGADLVTDAQPMHRDRSFRISQYGGRKTIQTKTGIMFYLDSISAGNSIIETFVNGLHRIDHADWQNKTIVDVGPEYGDTPLYFAGMGAKVYAFEMQEDHYSGMLQNLELNPELARNVIPVHAAIGKDGMIPYTHEAYTSSSPGASIQYNTRSGKITKSSVQGYTLGTAIRKFNIGRIDLLKMDCKGCEHSLTVQELENVQAVKIEHLSRDHNKLETLIDTLEKAGFEWVLYRQNLQATRSNRTVGYIYARKK